MAAWKLGLTGFCCSLAMFSGLAVQFPLAKAAEVMPVASKHCKLLIKGSIERGDIDKVRAGIGRVGFLNEEDSGGDPTAAICLDSEGGSFSEAVEIAKVLAEKGAATVVDENMKCLAACAVVFMAGRTFGAEDDYINRKLHIHGQLGFQAPYVEVPEGQYNQSAIRDYYLSALSDVAKFLNVANQSGGIPTTPRVKASLVEQMLLSSRNSFYYIDDVDRAGRWDIELFGYRISKPASKLMMYNACDNLLNWKEDKFAQTSNVEYGIDLNSKAAEAEKITIEKLSDSENGYKTVAHVDFSGLDSEWCDVYTDNPDSGDDYDDQWIRVCALDVIIQFGADCEDKKTAFGLGVPAFAMFDGSTKIADLPLAAKKGQGK